MPAQPMTARGPYRPAAAMFVVGWGANMFTPLLMVYAHTLSDTALSMVFAMYSLGLFPSLLFGAQLSDRWGRRRLMRIVLVVAMIGSGVLLLAGDDFTLLAVGRVIVGLAAGAAFGPGTVWLNELNDRSGANRSAATLTAVALTGGFAAGPLFTGVLAQWLPWPCALAYLVHMGLLLVVAPVIWFAPETAPRGASIRRRPPKIGRALRHPLFSRVMLPTAPWVFGSIVAAIVVLPQSADLGDLGIAATGGLAALTLLTGVCVQPLAARSAARSGLGAAFVHSLVLLAIGLLLGAAMELTRWTFLLVLAALPLGAAYGFLLTAGLRLIPLIAAPEERSLVTGIFYVLAYSGFFWSVLVNVLAPVLPKAATFAVFAVVAVLTILLPRTRAVRPALQPTAAQEQRTCARR